MKMLHYEPNFLTEQLINDYEERIEDRYYLIDSLCDPSFRWGETIHRRIRP